MANNPDFLKLVTDEVVLQWPRLDQPYRYNPLTQRSEACSPTAPNAGYSVSFEMEPGNAKTLFETARAHYVACRTRNTRLPEFSQVFGMKKDEERRVFRFSVRKRAANNEGKVNKPPAVIGPDHKPLADPAIWTGSTGRVRFFMFPATDPQTGKGGITLLLDTVMVTKPVYGGDDFAADFGAPQENAGDSDNPGDFGSSHTTPGAASASHDNEFGF